MGLTIHWSFQGPKTKPEARAIIAKMRQRAMDLPFDSVSELIHLKGPNAQFERGRKDDEFGWLKIMASQTIWNAEQTLGWDCPAQEIIGFQIDVAPGSEPMELYLASYPKTIQVEDERTGAPRRMRTNLSTWSGRGFCKTQYASDPDCGGVPNFLRAHLSVCRMLDCAKELGILASVSDEGDFFENRDIPALVSTVGDWNAFIAAGAGVFDEFFGGNCVAPIKDFPDFEHLEAKGQDQIEGLLRWFKERRKHE